MTKKKMPFEVKGCAGCVHLDSEFHCVYILNNAGRSRAHGPDPAPRLAGGGCAKKETEEKPPRLPDHAYGQAHRTPEKPSGRRGSKGKSWNKEKALALYRQGLSDQKIGDAVGVSQASIALWRRAENLPTNHPKKQKGTRQ